jgi:MFS transporter, ACS family, pantothenate transporter
MSLADGIITLPIAVFGLFYFPDIPSTSKVKFLSAEEIALANSLLIQTKPDGHNVSPLSLAKRLLLTPIL